MACLILCTLSARGELADTFQSLSKKIPFLNPEFVLYHQPSNGQDDLLPLTSAEQRIMDSFYQSAHAASRPEIDRALKHGNPKVRAMAVAALCWTTSPPRFLPRLMAITEDSGASFPYLDFRSMSSAIHTNDIEARNEMSVESSVGKFAAAIVSVYMQSSGYHHELKDESGIGADAEFQRLYKHYWDKRKNRQHCLGWTLIELTRAWQKAGDAVAENERNEEFIALRERIDALPSPDREWNLIYITRKLPEHFRTGLASQAEQSAALNKLGRANLMAFLGRDRISDDPDLDLYSLNQMQASGYGAVIEFVLTNASQVLGIEDVDEILEIGRARDQNPMMHAFFTTTPNWWIAAALLDPDRAGEILQDARTRFSKGHYLDDPNARRNIELALWHHLGDAALEGFADWFYKETPSRGTKTDGRHWIAMRMAKPEYRDLFLTIVNDKRLDTLDWVTTIQLINAANHYTKKPLIDFAAMKEWVYYNINDLPMARIVDDKVQKSAAAMLPIWQEKLRDARKEMKLILKEG